LGLVVPAGRPGGASCQPCLGELCAWWGEAVGHSSGRGRRPEGFITPEILTAETILRHKQRELDGYPEDWEHCRHAWESYARSRASLDALIRGRREELFMDFAGRLKAMEYNEQLRTMNAIKRSRERSKASLLHTDPESLARYAAHYAAQCRNTQPVPEAIRAQLASCRRARRRGTRACRARCSPSRPRWWARRSPSSSRTAGRRP
jgi:hypothetical protein